jgi:UDP-N-acetylglucosamine:LPS N-acetylglucosamine transferase
MPLDHTPENHFILDCYSSMLYNITTMKTERTFRIDARLTAKEKKALLRLGGSQGCKGITAFLRLLAKAKR